MTLERALNKLERAGWNHDRTGQRVVCTKPNHDIVIDMMLASDESSSVVAVRVRRSNEHDDPTHNKYVGEWQANVSQAIAYAKTLEPVEAVNISISI